MPLTPGTRIGPYAIVGLLGAGGMGEVYRARDTRLDRLVALKLLPANAASDPDRRERFEREARAVAALNHPNIVTIHSVEHADGQFFLTMELVEGRPLAERLPPGGLPLATLLGIAIPVCDAVAAAHQKGITHRDLKPANIMIGDGDQQGRVKVLDFGLAKLTERPASGDTLTALASAPVTGEGRILGTVAYMSPEQAEGRAVDARSDLFSLGVILYEMATGRRPFSGDTSLSIMASIARDTPASVTALNPALPRDLGRIVRRALVKDVTRRYQTAADLRNDLEELRASLESGELDAAPASVLPPARRRWVVPAATAGVVVLGLGVAAALWWRRAPATPAPPPVFSATPFTSFPGSESSPTFSPDGRQIAFQWEQSSSPPDVYVQLTTGGAPLRLTHDGGAHLDPSWSPDGTVIAMWSVYPGVNGGTVRVSLDLVSPLGGPVKAVTDWTGAVGRIAWPPDGKWLAVGPENRSGGITLVAPATGERIDWAALDPAFAGSFEPAFSPDGRRVAYVRRTGDLTDDLYVVSVGPDGKPAGRPTLLDSRVPVVDPVWTPDGVSVLVCVAGGHSGVARIRADGAGGLERLGGLDYASSFALSRDGTALVFSRGGLDSAVWRVDLQDPSKSGPIVPSTLSDGNGAYSPDGRRVAFQSNRGGATQIWVADVSGDNAQALTTFDGARPGTPRWSPDGRTIAFDATPDGNADIFMVPAGGGPVRQLTKTPGEDARPAWSADGRAIYFSSDRSGRREIWRMAADGADLVQITRQGGQAALASPDGQLLYYTRPDGRAIYQIRLDGSGDTEVISDARLWGSLTYAVTTSGLWFVSLPTRATPSLSLRMLRFADYRIVDMATLDWGPSRTEMSISPDEHSALLTKPDLSGTDLWLVKDFH
jgi:serine/threonine protein kinase